eukprot:1159562-Pelagomonas_calceolata.AAC.2
MAAMLLFYPSPCHIASIPTMPRLANSACFLHLQLQVSTENEARSRHDMLITFINLQVPGG